MKLKYSRSMGSTGRYHIKDFTARTFIIISLILLLTTHEVTRAWSTIGTETTQAVDTVYGSTTTQGTPQTSNNMPPLRMFFLNRTYGPMWGGTLIGITLRDNLQTGVNISSIVFEPYGYVEVNFTKQSEWIIQSPMARTTGNVRVSIAYSINNITKGSSLIDQQFEYRPNPVVKEFYPTNHFTSGGTRLTVRGTNLDVPASAAMELRVVTYYFKTGAVDEKSITSDCYFYETDQKLLVCRMPKLDGLLAPSIEEKLLRDYNCTCNSTAPGPVRRRRQSTIQIKTLTSEEGDESADIYLSIKLDGQIVSPEIVQQFNLVPTKIVFLNETDAFVKITKEEETTFNINGGNFLQGAAVDDYSVPIGAQNSTILSVTDNLITCTAPLQEPARIQNNYTCNSDQRTILVSIAWRDFYKYGCAQYKDKLNPLVIIIPVAVGGGTLLIVLIIVILACILCCKRKSRGKGNGESHGVTHSNRQGSARQSVYPGEYRGQHEWIGSQSNKNYNVQIPNASYEGNYQINVDYLNYHGS